MSRKDRRRKLWPRALGSIVVLAIGLPFLIVLPWRWLEPPDSAFMMRAQAEGADIDQQWVSWESISPHLPIAVVAAEDQKFPEHRGFDTESIRSALEEEGSKGRGASTISQQVVKNLFLWPGRSLDSQGNRGLSHRLPRDSLAEAANSRGVFECGRVRSRNLRSRGRRSKSFFGKPASQLSARESALMATVLPSPKRMSPGRPSPYVEERAGWILRQMAQLGGPTYLEGM